MKNKYPFLIILIIVFFLQSCGSYKIFTGRINYNASSNNDVIKSGEFNSYLESKSQIKFVLRAPEGYKTYSEEDQIEWNIVFSQIEKELIRQGHIVKDRILLELLLDKGDMSLNEVGKAINTDIIIEVINIDFDISNQVKNFVIKEKGLKTNFDNWSNIDFVDCRVSMLECRVTLVNVGNVGGIFKFYVSGCDTGKEFYIKSYEAYSGDLDSDKDSYVGWNYGNVEFKSLTHTYNMNDLSRNKAIEKLVNSLLKEMNSGNK